MCESSLAIILDGNQRSALAAVRSLGRRGITVAVAESNLHPLASASRYCHMALVSPDPAKEPESYIEWLRSLSRDFPGAVLMPVTDVTTPLVLQSRAKMPNLRVALPQLSAYETASDKYCLFQLAQRAGVSVPNTTLVSRKSLDSLRPQEFRYPVVIKPRSSAMRLESGVHKRSVRYASDPIELRQMVAEALVGDSDQLILQEYVAGQGAGVFAIYSDGTPQFFFAHRRLRERPPSGGVSVLSESITLPEEGVAAAKRLLTSLAWHGVAMVEFKVDSKGRWWLIEVNARLWGSLQLAVDCGADFPWFLYQLATVGQVAPPKQYDVGRKLRWWLGDLDSLYLLVRAKPNGPGFGGGLRALAKFVLPWQPGLRYEFLRWDDPMPALAAFRQYADALRRRTSSI